MYMLRRIKSGRSSNGTPKHSLPKGVDVYRTTARENAVMRKLLFGLISLGALTLAVPASAQVYFGAGPGGVEVGVGGPRYGRYYDDDWRWRQRRLGGDYAYGSNCRVVRERIETPSGRVIFRSRRDCY